jgi:K+-sensing histidine kinase KdpD
MSGYGLTSAMGRTRRRVGFRTARKLRFLNAIAILINAPFISLLCGLVVLLSYGRSLRRPRRHFIAAVTGSGNSEYVIRWTDSSARRLNATWTVSAVSDPGREDPDGLERNLSLARRLGAGEVLSIADNDVASCIVQYAR